MERKEIIAPHQLWGEGSKHVSLEFGIYKAEEWYEHDTLLDV